MRVVAECTRRARLSGVMPCEEMMSPCRIVYLVPLNMAAAWSSFTVVKASTTLYSYKTDYKAYTVTTMSYFLMVCAIVKLKTWPEQSNTFVPGGGDNSDTLRKSI